MLAGNPRRNVMSNISLAQIGVRDSTDQFTGHPHTCAWAVTSLDRAIQSDNVDLIEEIIDSLKNVLSDSTQTRLFRKEYISALSYALGICFNQSGRLSVLDELIALRHPGERALLSIPFLACNIAEAMVTRAEVEDPQTATMLILEAFLLCHSRRNVCESSPIHARERALLDTQLIVISRVQLGTGITPFLAPAKIYDLTRDGLTTVARHPSERVGMIIAQVEALIALSVDTGPLALDEAERVLISELSHPSMASSLYCVDLLAARADVHVARLGCTRVSDFSSLLKAWKTYHWAVCHPASSGRARERFKVCLRWASHAVRHGCTSQALAAYSCAVNILPHVIFLGEDVLGRIAALRQANGLASSSASTALSMGQVSKALLFLEQTRGILWHQTFQTRCVTLEDLPRGLGSRFRSAVTELEITEDLAWTRRRRAAQALENVILEIRLCPTFERFLLPPLLEEITCELQRRDGFAVVIIPTSTHCDVVVIGGSNEHSHLRLAALNVSRVACLAMRLSSIRSAVHRLSQINRGLKLVEVKSPDLAQSCSADDELDVLAELWRCLVRPILQHLNILSKPPTERALRRRLWWCPVGELNLLPIHAAGLWREHTPEQIDNYVISSYVPTLTALYRMFTAKANEESSTITSPRILLVAQPHCTGLPSLPNTQIEVDLVRKLVSSDSLIVLPEASNDDILSTVGDVSVLHLACHGTQDRENPLNSGFELKDGRLTLAKLKRATIPCAQLAYLSACESAGTDESRPDEGLNLAGAMVFAGFKSVIATLWTMDDIDGPFMAERIYRSIIRDNNLDLSAIPSALDDAIRELRDTGVPVSRWATYVHFGV